jgi:signal transduction histidine kinase
VSFELLEKGNLGELNEKGKNKASQGVRVIRRLNSLIDAFLNVEKLESGEVELRYDEIAIVQLIQRAVDSVQNLAERKGVIFQITSGKESLQCDIDKMTDVLTNLLHNSIKFSPNNSIVGITSAVTESTVELIVAKAFL